MKTNVKVALKATAHSYKPGSLKKLLSHITSDECRIDFICINSLPSYEEREASDKLK